MSNYFKTLSAVDVSAHVKQKGQFSYLSWPFAIETLGEHHPEAKIEVKRFPLPDNTDVKVPYLQTPVGYFVEVAVTINDVKRSQLLPVLDYKNQPLTAPTPFEINTSIQRAMVKAIALHGLGLFIYQGEDLPLNAPDFTEEQHKTFTELVENESALDLFLFFQHIPVNASIGLVNSFPKGQKGKMKDLVNKLEKKGAEAADEYENLFIASIDAGDKAGLQEAAEEIGEAGKVFIWQRLTNEQQQAARELLNG